jgi:hypothetical protein
MENNTEIPSLLVRRSSANKGLPKNFHQGQIFLEIS